MYMTSEPILTQHFLISLQIRNIYEEIHYWIFLLICEITQEKRIKAKRWKYVRKVFLSCNLNILCAFGTKNNFTFLDLSLASKLRLT